MQSFSEVFFSYTEAARAAGVMAALVAANAATGAPAGQANCIRRQFHFVSVPLQPVPPNLIRSCSQRSCPGCKTPVTLCRETHSTGRATLVAISQCGSQDSSQKSCSNPAHRTLYDSWWSRNRYVYSVQRSHTISKHSSSLRVPKGTSYCASASSLHSVSNEYSLREGVSCCGTYGPPDATWPLSHEPPAPSPPGGSGTGFTRCNGGCKIRSSISRSVFRDERLAHVVSRGTSTGRPAVRKDILRSYLLTQTESCTRGPCKQNWGSQCRGRGKLAACCDGKGLARGTAGQRATGGHWGAPAHSHCSPDTYVAAPADICSPAVPHAASSTRASHRSVSTSGPPIAGGGASYFLPWHWACFYSRESFFRPSAASKVDIHSARRAAVASHASPSAQTLTIQDPQRCSASCAVAGAALVVDAATGGAASSKETLPRPPREDTAVDLPAEVVRAVESLRRLQQQQRQLQTQHHQEKQQQTVLLDKGRGHPETRFSCNKRWQQPDLTDEDLDCLKKRWLALLTRLRPFGHISTGNSVKLFDNGDKAFTAMLHEIDHAQNHVLLETYMFDASLPACRVKDALCEAAQRGCFVVLIIDWIGSFNMPYAWKEELLKSGVHLVIFNPRFFLPVFSGSYIRPQESISGTQKNIFSPVLHVLQSFSASPPPPESSQLLSQPEVTTSPSTSGNSSTPGPNVNASDDWRESSVNSESRTTVEKMSHHADHSARKGSAIPQVSISSHSETVAEGRARVDEDGEHTLVTGLLGLVTPKQTNEGKAADEKSTRIARVKARLFVEEQDPPKPKDADSGAQRAPPFDCVVSNGTAASHEVRIRDGATRENTAAPGIESGVPKGLLWANKIGPVPFRDHRKILIVDGKSAFIGSLNISEDGVGKQYGGRGFFYDLHARLRGPVVQHLQLLVFETLETSGAFDLAEQLHRHVTASAERQGQPSLTQKVLPCRKQQAHIQREKQQRWPWLLGRHWRSNLLHRGTNRAAGFHWHHYVVFQEEDVEVRTNASDDDAEDVLIQVLKSNVLHNERSIQLALQAAISSASKSVCLTSSYFIPPGFLRRALHAALARGGVDVSLLLSGNSDVWGDVYATIYVVRKFLTKNSRRHSLFSAGWERSPLKEKTFFSDMTSEFPSMRQLAPAAPPHFVAESESVRPQAFQSAAGPAHVTDTSKFTSVLLPHKFPMTADAKFEEQAATGTRTVGNANARAAALASGSDGEAAAHVNEAVTATKTIPAADQATTEAGRTAGGATARDAINVITTVGEETGPTDTSQGRAGVYFLSEHHCHAKNIVVDHIWSSLGSFNFDRYVRRPIGGSELKVTLRHVYCKQESDAHANVVALFVVEDDRLSRIVLAPPQLWRNSFRLLMQYGWLTTFSSRRNLEVLVTFFDPHIAYNLETFHWKRITEEAEEMTVEKWNHQPFIKKLLCSCCYYLTRFAGKNFFDGLSDQRSRAVLKRLLIASYLDDMPPADIFLGMAWGVH